MYGISTIVRLNNTRTFVTPQKLTAAQKLASTVKLGQTYRDNDPRMDRTLTVLDIYDEKAKCRVGASKLTTRIRLDRLGTPRLFTLVRDENGKRVA